MARRKRRGEITRIRCGQRSDFRSSLGHVNSILTELGFLPLSAKAMPENSAKNEVWIYIGSACVMRIEGKNIGYALEFCAEIFSDYIMRACNKGLNPLSHLDIQILILGWERGSLTEKCVFEALTSPEAKTDIPWLVSVTRPSREQDREGIDFILQTNNNDVRYIQVKSSMNSRNRFLSTGGSLAGLITVVVIRDKDPHVIRETVRRVVEDRQKTFSFRRASLNT